MSSWFMWGAACWKLEVRKKGDGRKQIKCAANEEQDQRLRRPTEKRQSGDRHASLTPSPILIILFRMICICNYTKFYLIWVTYCIDIVCAHSISDVQCACTIARCSWRRWRRRRRRPIHCSAMNGNFKRKVNRKMNGIRWGRRRIKKESEKKKNVVLINVLVSCCYRFVCICI